MLFDACAQPLANGGRLPLHVALENKADERVVMALLEANPAAARMASKKMCNGDFRVKVCSRACVCLHVCVHACVHVCVCVCVRDD